MNNKHEDIHKRIYNFVIRLLRFTKKLTNTPENQVIRHQIAKSATSMGANDQEADASTTPKDFASKYSIVRKETKETIYWLNIIKDTTPISNKETESLIIEGTEIFKIVSTIIYKTKNKKD